MIMRHLALMILFCTLLVGCGGGGGSGNPVNPIVSPLIASIQPQTGSPGTLVTIQGSNFGTVQGGSLLSLAGVTVQPSSWSDNVITAVIPATAQANGSFVLTVNGVVSAPSAQFVISNPILSGIFPSQGAPGSQVTLSGQFFGALQGNSTVKFNALPARVLSWSDSMITCEVPSSGLTSGFVSVVVWVDGTRPTGTGQFQVSVPTVSNVQPAIDNIGARVTVVGQGFGSSQSQVAGQVTIGGIPCTVTSWSDTAILVIIPQVGQAGVHNVIVTVNGRPTTPGTVQVAAPQITSYSPNQPGNGDFFSLQGSYFGQSQSEGNGQVQLQVSGSGVQTVQPGSWSDSQISFTWPISNSFLGTQQVSVIVTVGGLSTTIQVTAD